MSPNHEIILGDFKVKLSDTSIYISKLRNNNIEGYDINDCLNFLRTIIICSDNINYISSDDAYIISPQYRLVINDMYIFLGKVNIEKWSIYKMDILDFKGKWNLIKSIEYFFSFSKLW